MGFQSAESRESTVQPSKDASAIVEHTTQVIYLNDNEMAVLRPGSFRTTTSFKQRASIARCNLTHCNGALAPGQWTTKSFLHCPNR